MTSPILSAACLLGCVSFAVAADADGVPPSPTPTPSGSSTHTRTSTDDRPQNQADAKGDRRDDRSAPLREEDPSGLPRGNPATSPATTPGNPGISADRNGTSNQGGGTHAGGTGGIESGGSGR